MEMRLPTLNAAAATAAYRPIAWELASTALAWVRAAAVWAFHDCEA
jgi:hypothetical protein